MSFITSILLLITSTLCQTDNSNLLVYYNGQEIKPQEGINLSEIEDPKKIAKLSFKFKEDIENKEDLLLDMDITVVSEGRALTSRKFQKFKEGAIINVQPVLFRIKPGDSIIIELANNLSNKPNFFSINVNE